MYIGNNGILVMPNSHSLLTKGHLTMGLRIAFGQNIDRDCVLQLCCWKFSIGIRYHGPKDFLTFGLGPKNFIFTGPHHSLQLVVAKLVERPNWHVKNHLMVNRWTKNSCFCHWHDLLFINANEALFVILLCYQNTSKFTVYDCQHNLP
jgi:hypothetical protein